MKEQNDGQCHSCSKPEDTLQRKKKEGPTRRQVLSRAAVSMTALVAGGSVQTYPQTLAADASPNEKINLGVIGIGPRCTYDLTAMLKFPDVRCVAISDVQASRRRAGKTLVDNSYGNQDCLLYQDFRELLAREDIDAVLIATGDRWHADASILAAEAGKDVYSEKPCGITIERCQALTRTIKKTKRIFQAGTQRRSVPNFQTAVQLVHEGKLGQLQTMHASVYRPVIDNTWLAGQPLPGKENVDWNLWLGPAPWRPFNQAYVKGQWRGQWDFDSGARLLDWGAHTIDLCQWANRSDSTMPLSYEPEKDRIICTYKNGVKLIVDFLDDPFGDRSPSYITRLGTCPVRFEGDEGWVETGDSGEIVVSNQALQKELPKAAKRVRGLDVTAHARDFFDCIRTRKLTAANVDVMKQSHIACHAAAAAWAVKESIIIDPATAKFDSQYANQLLARPRRDWAALS